MEGRGAGLAREVAAKVITPKPRKAKNVRATLGDDISQRRVAGEGQEMRVDVGQRRHREHGENTDNHVHYDRLGSGHRLRAQNVEDSHSQEDKDGEGLIQAESPLDTTVAA